MSSLWRAPLMAYTSIVRVSSFRVHLSFTYWNLTFLPDCASASGHGAAGAAAPPRPPAAGAAAGTGGTAAAAPGAGVGACNVRGLLNHFSTDALFMSFVTSVTSLGPSARRVRNP